EALKQNGKYDEAANIFLAWGEKQPSQLEQAKRQANICGVARVWPENADIGASVENEIGFNSEHSEFSHDNYGEEILFTSDRWQKNKKGEDVYGWTGNPYLKVYSISRNSKQISLVKGKINIGYHNGVVATAHPDTLIFTRTVMPPNKKMQ